MTANAAAQPCSQSPRTIVHQTSGRTHGPITRLMSPSDLGEHLKPFVFLDIFSMKADGGKSSFGMHPHSGIATVTYMINGEVAYEDTTGAKGVLPQGGLEWMSSGNGVWHDATVISDTSMLGFQLWLALPAAQENAPAHSRYLAPTQIPQEGPAKVLLGQYGAARSNVALQADLNYLAVTLQDGEHWRYTPPAGHTVAWVAVNAGALHASGAINAGELAAFEENDQPIDFIAHGATSFVLGSAVKHPHDLVMGHYSVHTNKAALAQGEAEIRRIGSELSRQGRLRQAL